MSDVIGALFEQEALLDFQCTGVEVPAERGLHPCRRELIYIGDIGHALIVNVLRGRSGLSPNLIGGATKIGSVGVGWVK